MIEKDYKIRIGNSRISRSSLVNGMVNSKRTNRYLLYSLNNLNDRKLIVNNFGENRMV
jgi:hypothetical protein